MTIDMFQADKILQDLWDKDVRAWHKWWVPIFRRFAIDLTADARLRRGQIILDVGTGTGVAAVEAAKRVAPGGVILGIDRSKRMLEFAEANTPKTLARNLSYFVMDAEHMLFPNELFDGIVSNCGISYANFPNTVSEIFRVLRRGGIFTLNYWHLIDVPAHKKFSEILHQYRTQQPSQELRTLRAALATYEHTGNRYADPRIPQDELRRAGFNETTVRRRNYKIRLNSIEEYLDLRLKRAALKQERLELSKAQRTRLFAELKTALKGYVHGRRFILDWKVTFIQARKPGT